MITENKYLKDIIVSGEIEPSYLRDFDFIVRDNEIENRPILLFELPKWKSIMMYKDASGTIQTFQVDEIIMKENANTEIKTRRNGTYENVAELFRLNGFGAII